MSIPLERDEASLSCVGHLRPSTPCQGMAWRWLCEMKPWVAVSGSVGVTCQPFSGFREEMELGLLSSPLSLKGDES